MVREAGESATGFSFILGVAGAGAADFGSTLMRLNSLSSGLRLVVDTYSTGADSSAVDLRQWLYRLISEEGDSTTGEEYSPVLSLPNPNRSNQRFISPL